MAKIITIDGPAGSGKSSTARALARRLGFEFLDTGAMFRAVTLAGQRAQIDLRDERAMSRLLEGVHLEMPAGEVMVNGEDIGKLIRTQEVTEASGAVASNPTARHWLAALQRAIASGRNMVCEGRDQGTVVFPDAFCKFFLIAEPEERARRRLGEMLARGESATFEDILASQKVRDQRDAARDLAPMKPADDAIIVDSTRKSLEEIVDRMVREVNTRRETG